jgi:hypothetical protein
MKKPPPRPPRELTEDEEIAAQEAAFHAKLRPRDWALMLLAILQICPGSFVAAPRLFALYSRVVREETAVLLTAATLLACLAGTGYLAWFMWLDDMRRAEKWRVDMLRENARRALRSHADGRKSK